MPNDSWPRADAARFGNEGEELRQPGRPRQSETSLKAAAAPADLSRNQSAYTVLKADQPGSSGRSWPRSDRLSVPDNRSFRYRAPGYARGAIAIRKTVLTRRARRTTPRVTLWAEEGTTYRGRLREIAAMADHRRGPMRRGRSSMPTACGVRDETPRCDSRMPMTRRR